MSDKQAVPFKIGAGKRIVSGAVITPDMKAEADEKPESLQDLLRPLAEMLVMDPKGTIERVKATSGNPDLVALVERVVAECAAEGADAAQVVNSWVNNPCKDPSLALELNPFREFLGSDWKACAEIPVPSNGCSEVPLTLAKPEFTPEVMGLHIKRPRELPAMVYKITSPHYEHSFYLTLADIILNEGTPFEERRPYEMFLNTQNGIERGWIEKDTLDTSFLFRTGMDISEQLKRWKKIADPKGGWMRPNPDGEGGGFIGSLQAEIACYIEHHMKSVCGKTSRNADSLRHKAEMGVIAEFSEYEQAARTEAPAPVPAPAPVAAAPAKPAAPVALARFNPETDCEKCRTKNSIRHDGGCPTCTNCGDSKCS